MKDKRVDYMLQKRSQERFLIYYGPITFWLFFYVVLLVQGGLAALSGFGGEWAPVLLVGHFIGSYLLASRRSNSVALGRNALYLVNPNFPFLRFTRINFSEIQSIHMAQRSSKWLLIFAPLGVLDTTHLQITTAKGTAIYYCMGMENDYLERANQAGTSDDLYDQLKARGVAVTEDLC